MRPELIGRNSAFNSMIFMGANGFIKQLGGIFLSASGGLFIKKPSLSLLMIISISMLIATLYVCFRKRLFNVIV
jgi:hypothetical protein